MWGWIILGVVVGALALLVLFSLLVMADRGEEAMERFLGALEKYEA